MGKIHLLDSDTINQIAAGEVVERPASVVKELVENAVDAGAGAITVEIREGGIGFIRVTDNGGGIAGEDIPMAFSRHATSKIATALDLFRVKSLGFRGEALSSIAAVSMVELVTKTRGEFTGSRYVIEGGQEKERAEIGAPEGTTFLVRSLFYNTPARRKFLKSSVTEAGYISDLMQRFATAHPEIAFKFINNGKTLLQTSGNGNLKDCIYHIFGRDIAAALVEADGEGHGIRITGFLGKPVISRGNRNYENYFINGRYIRSNIISKAMEEAYKPYLMQHKYPFTALHLTIPAENIDVNVHPTKLEVRFTNGEAVYQLVYQTVQEALSKKNMIPDVLLTEEKKVRTVYQPTPEMFEHGRITYSKGAVRDEAERVREEAIRETLASPLFSPKDSDLKEKTQRQQDAQEKLMREEVVYGNPADKEPEGEKPHQISLFQASGHNTEAFLKQKQEDHHHLIGQLFATYWLVEFKEQLFIIDQHAAHEKILYERTLARMGEKQVLSQMLTPPIILELSIREEETLQRYMGQFLSLGFEIESFGGREYAVRAVPQDLYGVDGRELFLEMLDHLITDPPTGAPDIILEKIASLSCKAAVKGNTKLSGVEAEALIHELLQLGNPFHCPHGRPVIVSITKNELERKFKRIVN
ncbi:MAG: DNA mismatch repair endonuclease MutL [Lachnospiraceae bacterium]|nr:DNA mismatch repair endonuclease MutL [Lachnospiraceae bacterium]